MVEHIEKWARFAVSVVKDQRIPTRHKAIAGGMVAWLVSPVDLIPDFIPILGQVDDAIVLVLLLDYLFNEIPMEVLLDHYPGAPVNLLRMRRKTRTLRRFIPEVVIDKLWRAAPSR